MKLDKLLKNTDLVTSIGVVLIMCVLLFPMPGWLLDIALSTSFSISVLILMVSLFAVRPLDFNVFPTVLLITAMLRLSLNVASTRLILTHGHEGPDAAGYVIEAFGNFVMGGNFLVGMVIFIILIIINFVVITKGAGRISEVTARFTLDSMPGKQMAIDSDLSSGLIDEEMAKKRRREVESESSFYGAMDGASKFVRGDAVAGLLITAVNILGGITIGVVQMKMNFNDALNSYTLLTVGDGLVSQVPALIISTAAGLLISKAGLNEKTDKILISQLGRYPKALGMSALLLAGMGLLPGLPAFPFLLLSALLGSCTYMVYKGQKQSIVDRENEKQQKVIEEEERKEKIFSPETMDDLRIELGINLLPMTQVKSDQSIGNQMNLIRKQMLQDYGFIMPSLRITDNMNLDKEEYAIYVKEILVSKDKIYPDKNMIISPDGSPINLTGIETKDPAFHLPAIWIDHSQKEQAVLQGYTMVNAQTVLITHFTEILKEHMAELISSARVQEILDQLPPPQKKVFADIIPAQIPLNTIQLVLQNLLGEKVSIRDMGTILDSVCQAIRSSQNIIHITEYVRSRLSRQLCHNLLDKDGNLSVIMFSPEWETLFSESLVGNQDEKKLSMAPDKLQDFVIRLKEIYGEFMKKGANPTLLTSATIRPYVRSIVDRVRPSTFVMSHQEVHHRISVHTEGYL